jgi:hypothetical protein
MRVLTWHDAVAAIGRHEQIFVCVKVAADEPDTFVKIPKTLARKLVKEHTNVQVTVDGGALLIGGTPDKNTYRAVA